MECKNTDISLVIVASPFLIDLHYTDNGVSNMNFGKNCNQTKDNDLVVCKPLPLIS